MVVSLPAATRPASGVVAAPAELAT
jgi:hypothetical protein